MDAVTVREKLWLAIQRHLRENPGGALVVNPDGLIERCLEELGLADTISHNGWAVRRVEGSKIKGTPRGSRHCYGFVATKPGRKDEVAEPSAGYDVPLDSFKRALDNLDRIYAAEKRTAGQ